MSRAEGFAMPQLPPSPTATASLAEARFAREGGKLRPTAISTECIDDLRGFEALRPEWNDLLRASAADCPFLTWEWLHAWWTHLRGASALGVLAVRAGDQLIAVAPFHISRGTLPWFAQLDFLGRGAGSDYLDLIVRRGCEAEGLGAIEQSVRAQKRALRLDYVSPGSMASRLAQRMAGGDWSALTVDGGTCPFIRLAGHTWDSYLATLGSSHRANVRRRLRALEQTFEVRFELARTEPARREALEALAAFSERRRQGGDTAFATPAHRAFQNEATRGALEGGWLRLHVLRLNGAIAGVMYGFQYTDRFYFYQHGFDERYKPQSAGLVLMALSIRAAIEEGAAEFDMLWGLEPYKFLWARDTRSLERIHLFPTSIGGRIHQQAVVARRSLRRLARRALSTGDPCAA